MVNKELIDLCRLMVTAIGESDAFSAGQLKAMLLHIVPQLLAELDILSNVLDMLRPAPDEDPPAPEPAPAAEAPPAPVEPARQKKTATKKRPKKKRKK